MSSRYFALLILTELFLIPQSQSTAQDAPAPVHEAAQRMTLPEGFHATLFAGEPDVVQPIAISFDDRGRLWVVECYSYPKWAKEGRDRILIFEDRDGDGQFDERKVFFDKGANFSGLITGFGGAWVCATPYLLFIPDRNGDDVPDGPPEVVLDGWDLQARHNVFAALNWGPDGWLYGCNGILSNSKIGRPGTPEAERVAMNCGVWRYHPVRQAVENVAHGTTNPWGLDFDEYGQIFITNCVIHHLWHMVPGAHTKRMYGQDPNPHSYGLLESCADHIHWAGGPWQSSRGGQGEHSVTGGGHAHAGAMVYLGDNWPDTYRNGLFTCNIHGSRVNHDILERHGSSYVAHHGKDMILANDPWFRGLGITYGPDGGVYVSDWCDTGECHDYEEVHQTSGRIYKVVYGDAKSKPMDLAKLTDAELVQLQLHKNDWQVRHARRLLHERAAAGKLAPETSAALLKMVREQSDVTRRLRALWTLHCTGSTNEALLTELLNSPEEHLRGWAVQLELEDRQVSPTTLARLAEMAQRDPSALVRLNLASVSQRLPFDQRWGIVEGLVSHSEDATDAYLPLMIWYAIEPLVPTNAERAVRLLTQSKIPIVREYIARRIAVSINPESTELAPLVQALDQQSAPLMQRDILRGMYESLNGRRQVAQPKDWSAVAARLSRSTDAEVKEKSVGLSVLFGDPQALAELQKTIRDTKQPAAARQFALQALVQKKNAELVPLLQSLIDDRAMRGPAIRGLAAYNEASTPRVVLEKYASYSDDEKRDAVNTLASRPTYALALLEAMEKGQVPRNDVSAFTARQLQGLKDKQVNQRLTQVWGVIRPASQEKAALISKYKSLLTPENLKKGDLAQGRAVYARTCASCHVLFDAGSKIGPELTGGQRTNLDYVLENLLDPSAVVGRDYQVTLIETNEGRIITGIIKQENDNTVTVQTPNEVVIIPKNEIEERTRSPLSMMPEGQVNQLKDSEVRDLVSYLASPKQVPLPTK